MILCMIISNNIGYVDKFPTELVCKSFETKEWTNKLLSLLINPNLSNILTNITFDNTNFDIFINTL